MPGGESGCLGKQSMDRLASVTPTRAKLLKWWWWSSYIIKHGGRDRTSGKDESVGRYIKLENIMITIYILNNKHLYGNTAQPKLLKLESWNLNGSFQSGMSKSTQTIKKMVKLPPKQWPVIAFERNHRKDKNIIFFFEINAKDSCTDLYISSWWSFSVSTPPALC